MLGFTGNGQPLSIQRIIKTVYSSVEEDLWINSCTCDIRSLRPGDLFVAIADARGDGHSQVEEAQRRGCKAVLAERMIPGVKIPYFIVKNSKEAYGVLCQHLYGRPAEKLNITAVTGTSGKTCAAFLIAGTLAEAGKRVGLISTLGIYDGEKMFPSTSTTPPANELAYWFSRMLATGCTDVILEVSSDAIDQQHLAGISLDAVCLTNIRTDHLDYHETVEHYRKTKLAIFRYVKKEAIAVCNIDDPVINAVVPLINNPILTVGIREQGDIHGTLIEQTIGEQIFYLTAGMETAPVRTRRIGNEQISNCLIAAALGISRGIDLKKVIRGLERVDNIPGRLERIDCGQPFGVFLDSAQTHEALITSLKTLQEVTTGRVFCLFGTQNSSDRKKLEKLGKALEIHADQVILTADSLTTERPEKTIRGILKGMDAPQNVRKFRDRTDAISWALTKIQPADTLLIVSGSHDESLDIPDYDASLSDRALVKEWFYENQTLTIDG